MAAPSYTYTLTNGTTADASQVMQNFNDVLNGITDGTKDLSINALTCAGTATLNGHINLGNSSSDDLTITASLASSLGIKTTNSYNVGDSTHGLASIYFGANSQTVRVMPSSSMSATWTLTLPVTAGTNNYIMTTNGSGVSAWTSWTNSAWYADGSNAGTLSATTQTIGGVKTFSSNVVLSASDAQVNTGTSDASDNHSLTVCGGGDASRARGSCVGLYGNEYTTTGGRMQLLAGDSSTAAGSNTAFYFQASASTGAASTTVLDITGAGAHTIGPSGADTLSHSLNGQLVHQRATSSTSGTMTTFKDVSGDTCGLITINATANSTTYGTSSDARKKDDQGDFSALELVQAGKPRKYLWKHAPESGAEVGFFAQELQTVVPYAVAHDVETDVWSVDYGRVSAILWKAVQELAAKVA